MASREITGSEGEILGTQCEHGLRHPFCVCGLLDFYVHMCCIPVCMQGPAGNTWILAGSGGMEVQQPCLSWSTGFGTPNRFNKIILSIPDHHECRKNPGKVHICVLPNFGRI